MESNIILTDEILQEIIDKVAGLSCVDADYYWIIDKDNKTEKQLTDEVVAKILEELEKNKSYHRDRIEDYKKANINTLDELEKFINCGEICYPAEEGGGEWFEYDYIFDKLIIGYTK